MPTRSPDTRIRPHRDSHADARAAASQRCTGKHRTRCHDLDTKKLGPRPTPEPQFFSYLTKFDPVRPTDALLAAAYVSQSSTAHCEQSES